MVQEADCITRPPGREMARFPVARARDQREPSQPQALSLAHRPPRHLNVLAARTKQAPRQWRGAFLSAGFVTKFRGVFPDR